MANQLVMKTGPAPGKVYSLEKSEISIGREVGSDVFINDVEVSRQHARLTSQGDNYALEDLNSTNGTFVNGQRLSEPRLLQPNDTIILGENVSLTFETVPFDPNATQVSSTSTEPAANEADFGTIPPREEESVAPISPPPPIYAGRVPPSPVDPLVLEEPGPRRTWLWASLGCAFILICLAIGAAFVFDALALYCTPLFRDASVSILGAACP
jgi:predicted component of type VI protein secretion system